MRTGVLVEVHDVSVSVMVVRSWSKSSGYCLRVLTLLACRWRVKGAVRGPKNGPNNGRLARGW